MIGVLKRPSLMFLAAALVCASAVAQPQLNPAERVLADVVSGERISDSGRLCFTVSANSNSVTAALADEVNQTERVEYAWAPGGKFKMILFGKNGPIRTIVSDGKAIDTGAKIWDARFAFDYSPHFSDENFDLGEELRNLMWPYDHVLHLHLHPVTGFRNIFTVDSLKKLYEISIVGDRAAESEPTETTLKLQMPEMRALRDILHVRREAIAYVSAADDPVGSGITLKYERTPPREIEGIGWVPARCSARFELPGEDKPSELAVSELCAEQPNPAVDAGEFAVDYDKSPMIPWPHGSRMKNFWYGIVNTFKDLWEGIADGEIGD